MPKSLRVSLFSLQTNPPHSPNQKKKKTSHHISVPISDMEQAIVDSLNKLQLTKEEEEDIFISTKSTPDLIEECSLSLFGRLLADRQQNLRALKSTLKAT